MNILLLGSGGREHALACENGPPVRTVPNGFIAPGNPGTARIGYQSLRIRYRLPCHSGFVYTTCY
jgi:phosphoribosylamine-glycine ligase